MTASSVGFRPMRRLDLRHNADDVELMHEIEKAYEPKVYFAASHNIYTDGRCVYGHILQHDPNGCLIENRHRPVTAFVRIPIPE